MNTDAVMSLEGIVIISLVVAAAGTALSHLFRNARSPYLVTLTGSRAELLISGAIMWATALGVGIAALLIVTTFASPLVALAIFFGIEAVALDICANRTRYVRTDSPALQYSRVRVTLPFNY